MRSITFSSGDSVPIHLKTGRAFVALTGTFNTASVDLEWQDEAGNWHPFSDLTAQTSAFDKFLEAGGPMFIRAGIQSGAPTGNLTLSVSREEAPLLRASG